LNPAQLSAIVDRTPYVKDRSQAQRLQTAGLAGTIAIKGRVVKSGEHLFIEHQEDGFRSKLSVSPGVGLKAYEGRDVIVAGKLDEWPSSLAFLREARVVDARGLKASSEPTAPGMVRVRVQADRIRTAPGKGVATRDVQGVLYHGRGGTGSNGLYTFKEDVTVLLRDGWAYDRLDVPPSDLNLKASRELEPQRWCQWRRAGGGYEIRWQDDHGRAKGDWRKADGRLVDPWPSGTRLAGGYTSAAFYGSLALGGTYTKNTRFFAKDGTYEDSSYSQSGSGSMAADNGFSSQTTSQSNKTGSTSVTGTTASTDSSGAMTSSGSPSMAVTGSAKRDDGARHRGQYSIDGYTLEIRRGNGQVDRLFTFKSLTDGIWIGDRTFSLPSKQ
jgi:hypothetical protein